MEHIIHNLSLNMHSSISQTSLYVKSGDTKRKLRITLTENGKVYRISDGCVAVFSAKKDNGDTLFNDCTIEGNTIVYELTAMTANVPGKIDCEIKLYDADNELITSPQFAIIVDDVVRNDEGVVASSEFSALTKLIADAIAVNKELNLKLAGGKLDFANAVKGQASGDVVSVNDISPAIHVVKCKVRGRNRVEYPYLSDGSTHNGVTYTVREDGTIGVHGTVDGDFSGFWLQEKMELVDGVTYYIGSSPNLYFAYKDNLGASKFVHDAPLTWSKDYTFVRLYLQYPKGTVLDEVIYPMVSVGNTATAYEPYIDPTTVTVTEAATGATYTPNTDGTCDVMSVYPTLALMTDTEGVTIECEYNRDNNMLMLDLINNVQELLKFAFKKATTIDLLASGWQGTESPYKQTVNIPFVTKNSRVTIDLDDEQLEFFRSKDIAFTTTNNGGVVTASCVGQKPENDYSVQVTVEEVLYIE